MIIRNELGVVLKSYVLYTCIQHILAGGFNYFLISSLLGEDSRFDEYFSNWLKPPTSIFSKLKHMDPSFGVPNGL